MAQPITIPAGAMIIPLNLSSSSKTLTLPVVSTNQGRILIFKDMFGNAANSTLRLSTIGLDRIERSNVNSIALSNPYGAWTFMNDGLTNWFMTNAYLNSLAIIPVATISIVSSGLLNNVDAASYTSGGTWTALVGNNQSILGSGTTTTPTPGGQNSIVFNGSGYGLDTTGYASSLITNYTMEVWFYAAANVIGNLVGEMGQASQGSYNVAVMSITSNIMYVGFWQGSAYQLNCGAYTANTWTCLCYSYAGTTVTGYVNGLQVNTGTSTRQPPATDHFGVGSAANPYGNLTGRIGAYKLYTRALTAIEVKQNYNALAPRFGLPSI